MCCLPCQERKVLANACLKKAALQHRAVRKWKCHIITTSAEIVVYVEPKEEEEDQDLDTQVTVEAFISFIWWLASPKPQSTSSSDSAPYVGDNCGYSFTYVESLIHDLLSFVEEKGWQDKEKGLHVERGDVVALREVAIDEMAKIKL